MGRYDFIKIIITFLLFFGVLRLFHYSEVSIKDDFLSAVWVEGMYIFNYGIVYIYRSFKRNGWSLSIAKSQPSFKFYIFGVTIVLILFSLFMPYELKVYWLFVSMAVLGVLFVYDLVVNGKH